MTKKGIPQIGIGLYSLHGTILSNILRKVSSGCRPILIDTAYKYNNEKEIGSILNECNMDKFFIQTKVCAKQLLGSRLLFRFDKKTVLSSFKLSQKRIGKNKIDSFLLHSPFPSSEFYYTSLIELQQFMGVAYIGVCNHNKEQLEKIKKHSGVYPMINQIEIHPYLNNRDLVLFCQDNDIIVQARSPFAHGDIVNEWMNNKILIGLSNKYNITIFQLILQWNIYRNIIPIFRTSSKLHLNENLCVSKSNIDESDVIMIDSLNRNFSLGFVSKK